MFKFIKNKYNIDDLAEIKLSNNVTKINSKDNTYIVKKVISDDLETLFTRLYLSHVDNFNLPLRGNNNKYVQIENESYYILYKYYHDEKILGYDLKLSFYVKKIAELHKKTYININSNDNYLESILNYLDDKIKELSSILNSRMEVEERKDYHSSNNWYFLLHYQKMMNALMEASNHVLNLENEVKNQKNMRLCLTYQNFDFEHILLKQEKIISIENIGFNLASLDIYNLISKLNINYLNIIPYINEYLKINPLNNYEKEYLMAMLYIFDYHRYNDIQEDLNHLIKINSYLDKVLSLDNEVIFSSIDTEQK
ncbi:MAG: hypothetical protein V8R16_03850 [Bacilli bacterium]